MEYETLRSAIIIMLKAVARVVPEQKSVQKKKVEEPKSYKRLGII